MLKTVMAKFIDQQGDLYHLLLFLVFAVLAVVGARLAVWLWRRTMGRVASSTQAAWAKPVTNAAVSRIKALALLLLLQPALEQLGQIASFSTTRYFALLQEGLYVLTVVAVALIAEALVGALLDWYMATMAHRTQTTLDEEFLPILQKLNIIVVLTIAGTIILAHFEINITGLLATAGVASLAVALAAQETLSNMFAGLSLLVDRPFREGDRVELNDGTLGDVIDVGMRTTKILTLDHTVVIIPNQELASSRIINLVYPDYRLRLVTQLGVGYDSDLRQVKSLIGKILSEQDGVLKDPAPTVFFIEFAESALILRIAFWIDDYRQRFEMLDTFNMTVKDWFEREAVEIPFPQRVLHLQAATSQANDQRSRHSAQPQSSSQE